MFGKELELAADVNPTLAGAHIEKILPCADLFKAALRSGGDIKKEHQEHLKQFQANFETKGFRKGKAPLDVVEQNINPEKLFEEVASHLISHAYGEKIKKHKKTGKINLNNFI